MISRLRSFAARLPYVKATYLSVKGFYRRRVIEPQFSKFMEEQKKLNPEHLDDIIDFSMTRWKDLIPAVQIREEIRDLLSLLQKKKVKRFLEIGTNEGGTFFMFCKLFGSGSMGISLDLPAGGVGGGYPEYKEPLYHSFASSGQTIHLLRGDSHLPSSLERVKEVLNGEKLDFLFIDGDHRYAGVKKDYEMYSPLVRENGIIAFHDIVYHDPRWECQVDLLWKELKGKNKTVEFIKDKDQGMGGIGVLFKK